MRSKFAVAVFAPAIALMAGTPLARADGFGPSPSIGLEIECIYMLHFVATSTLISATPTSESWAWTCSGFASVDNIAGDVKPLVFGFIDTFSPPEHTHCLRQNTTGFPGRAQWGG
jgi:hypothetical protein